MIDHEVSNNIYKKAINTFGESQQIIKAMEELGELTTALARYFTKNESYRNINEEIADVEIMLTQLKIIFNGSYYIEIPDNSWFAKGYYNSIEENLSSLLNKYNDAIVIIAGGLASKVIIANVSSKFQNASFIDIGSSFDILSTRNDTRAWGKREIEFTNSYENQLVYFKEVLPDNYDNINF